MLTCIITQDTLQRLLHQRTLTCKEYCKYCKDKGEKPPQETNSATNLCATLIVAHKKKRKNRLLTFTVT